MLGISIGADIVGGICAVVVSSNKMALFLEYRPVVYIRITVVIAIVYYYTIVNIRNDAGCYPKRHGSQIPVLYSKLSSGYYS